MPILVDTLRIFGFRGISNIEINLSKVCVLIGTNNSGKTSVLKAMQLAMGDYSRYITDEDFHIGNDDQTQKTIIIDTRIIPCGKDGKQIKAFEDIWAEEFSDNIQSTANGEQFVAIRTCCKHDLVRGGFQTERFSLEYWPEKEDWVDVDDSRKSKIKTRFDSLPFISIEAQRDIHQELRERSSFIGKILSGVDYKPEDINEIEKMVGTLNAEAVNKSDSLKNLKKNLENLSQSFSGAGHAEITPFPKKIRDLSKQFTLHFGESEKNSFSMEYHGMGTRSWATMLSVKSFIELMAENYNIEEKPFYPILSAEEPEAHLHPNAQRTLYTQLVNTSGQIIISTHSPYLAAIADQTQLRYLVKHENETKIHQLSSELEPEDIRRIQREVIHSRGELLFSKVIVLSEGETEEQALPQLFNKYFQCEPFMLGVNFIGVGGSGKKYKPYLSFAKDFNIPVFIFSDGEPDILKQLQKVYNQVIGEVDLKDCPNIVILEEDDFEGYLLNNGYNELIENAIASVDSEEKITNWIDKKQGTMDSPKRTTQPPCATCKQPIFAGEIRDYNTEGGRTKAIAEILDSQKPKYAQAITEKLCKIEAGKFPPKIIELFEKIKKGVKL